MSITEVRQTLAAAEDVFPETFVDGQRVKPARTPQPRARPKPQGRPLEHLLFHMPWLSRNAVTAWERNFAGGMARKARLPRWQPSQKQIGVMNRMVAEMFGDASGSLEVIER